MQSIGILTITVRMKRRRKIRINYLFFILTVNQTSQKVKAEISFSESIV